MLLGQDLGGRHQRPLAAVGQRVHQCHRGDRGLAGTDLALQQAGHWPLEGQVVQDLVGHAALGSCQLERQAAFERLQRASLSGQGDHRVLLPGHAPLEDRQLDGQQLLEREAAACLGVLVGRSREVHLA